MEIMHCEDKENRYWHDLLSGDFSATFPHDKSCGGKSIYKSYTKHLDLSITHSIQKVSNGDPFAALAIFLSTTFFSLYAHECDFSINDFVAWLPLSKDALGYDNREVGVRVHIEADTTFRDFAHNVADCLEQSFAQQGMPFLHVQENKDCKNKTYVIYDAVQALKLEDLPGADTVLFFRTLEGQMVCEIYYDTRYYSEESISACAGTIELCLAQGLTDSNIQLRNIKTLSEKEECELRNFNRTNYSFDRSKTIVDFIRLNAMLHSGKTIAVQGSKSLTYGEMFQMASVLAGQILLQQNNEKNPVCILLDNSLELIVSIAGILLSGCPFVLIDANNPKDRISSMINNCNAKTIISRQEDASSYNFDNTLLLPIDGLNYENWIAPLTVIDAKDTAYIVYTSGTTGTPKGIEIRHTSLLNLSLWYVDYYRMTTNDRAMKYTNVGFDASILEIMPCLLAAVPIYIVEDEVKTNVARLHTYIEEQKITICFLPTHICEMFSEYDNRSLRVLLTGGDKLKRCGSPNYEIYNNYGPAENTIVSSACLVDQTDGIIPIGKPIYNCQIYILRKDGQVQGLARYGEICLAGLGLTKGYINDISSGRFSSHPYVEGELIYHTGDIGRWMPNGNIEYYGRLDSQAELTGRRVELSEIENHLLRYPHITTCAVVIVGDDNPMLAVGYVSETVLEPSILANHLREVLPEYMVPRRYTPLREIPLTAHGKTDKKTLIRMIKMELDTNSERDLPKNATESAILDIWKGFFKPDVKLDMNTSFFDVGGNSILAMQIIDRMTKFGLSLSFKEFMSLETIGNMARVLGEREETHKHPLITALPDVENLYEPFSLTELQKSYLVGRNQMYDMGGVSTSVYMELDTELNIDRLERALNQLITRHPMLRAVFRDGKQVFLDHVPMYKIERNDVLYALNRDELLTKERERSCRIIYSGEVWPLFSVKAFHLSEKLTRICLYVDALIVDGRSMKILSRELIQLYNGESLPDLRITFRDYMLALSNFRESEMYLRDKAYWMNKVEEIPLLDQLPYATDPAKIDTPTFNKIRHIVPAHKWKAIKSLINARHMTPTAVLCYCYIRVLSHWSNQESLSVNLTVFSRFPFHEDIHNVVGDFTSVMLLAAKCHNSTTFWDNAAVLYRELLEAIEHRSYDGVEIIREIVKTKGLVGKAVMPFVFTSALFDDVTFGEDHDIGDVVFVSSKTSQVYIDCSIGESGNGDLLLEWDYVEELFYKEDIEAMFQFYLSQIINLDHDHKVAAAVSPRHEKILRHYNATTEDIKVQHLYDMFAEQVKKIPDHPAVVDSQREYTYREICVKAIGVEKLLKEQGVSPQDIVGVIAERNASTYMIILGILKLGAIFMPIDPEMPQERKEYMIWDSGCKFILNSSFLDKCGTYVTDFSNEDAGCLRSADDHAYIIYTSGSTGQPKGVLMSHRAVSNTINDISLRLSVGESDKILALSSLCFDLSMYDMFGSLSTGATLVVAHDQRDASNVLHTMSMHGITFWNSVPAVMDMVLRHVDDGFINSKLRLVLLSGDWIPVNLPARVHKHFPNATIISLGGATEAAIWSVFYKIDPNFPYEASIPYGRPLSNQTLYILNYSWDINPVGVSGELYIGGDGLATGYLNRMDLTSDSFIHHPSLGRLYRTGDYARLENIGFITFLGRRDQQVKLKGYRIELGEIESAILKACDCKNAVALFDKRHERIIAFVVTAESLDKNALRKSLKQMLPGYMIPMTTIQVPSIPLTTNGKIDRRRLLEMLSDESQLDDSPSDLSLSQDIDLRLVKAWESVLGVKAMSDDDSFFDMGGDSLKASMLLTAINEQCGIELSLYDIFENDRLYDLWRRVEELQITLINRDAMTAIECKGKELAYYEATYSQRAIYRNIKINPGSVDYNITSVLRTRHPITPQRMVSILTALEQRHEVLCARFKLTQNSLFMMVGTVSEPDVTIIKDVESDEASIRQVIRDCILPFDPVNGPLFRVALISITDGMQYIVFDMSHLITDGTSQQLLLRDFSNMCMGLNLPEPSKPYHHYLTWRQEQVNQHNSHDNVDYWKSIVERIDQYGLPCFRKNNRSQNSGVLIKGGALYALLSQELYREICKLAISYRVSPFMIMLSAFSIVLSVYTGQKEIVVGTPCAGRNKTAFHDVVGLFINTIPMLNTVDYDMSFRDFLLNVKKSTIDAMERQHIDFDILFNEMNQPSLPLFNVLFTMQNMPKTREDQLSSLYEPFPYDNGISKMDLSLYAFENGDTLELKFEYRQDIFSDKMISVMMGCLCSVLRDIVIDQSIPLHKINLLDEHGKQLWKEYNRTHVTHVSTCLQDVIKPSLDLSERSISDSLGNQLVYSEFYQNITAIANSLRSLGLCSNMYVGIMMERSIEMLQVIFGIMSAGGGYLPIDINITSSRLKVIAKDCSLGMLITDKPYPVIECLGEGVRVIDASKIASICSQHNEVSYNRQPLNDSLAYIIYTSGSTGEPKGVMVGRNAMQNLMLSMMEQYQIGKDDVVLFKTSFSFDVSVFEIFIWMYSRSGVCVLSQGEEKDPEKIISAIALNGVTVLTFVPSMLDIFLDYVLETNSGGCLRKVRLVLTAGEVLSPVTARKFYAVFGDSVKLYNQYGPTETTVYCSYCPVSRDDVMGGTSISIGKPFDNMRMYVMNEHMQLLPPGAPGEIMIAGTCVANGYLNKPDLTGSRFMLQNNECVYYRSGDLGALDHNGNMVFFERIDRQVKIRGYRIELSEIESVAERFHGSIKAVATVEKDMIIVAFTAQDKINISELEEHSAAHLPSYTIPSKFLQVDSIPLTKNGKIDHIALSLLIHHQTDSKQTEEVLSPLETSLFEIWTQVLGNRNFGLYDDFFRVGGNSISVIKMELLMAQNFFHLSAAELYEHNTIKKQAAYLDALDGETEGTNDPLLDKQSPSGKVILEGIQPFSDLYFSSCLYNSLFPIVNYFGLDISDILVTFIPHYQLKDHNLHVDQQAMLNPQSVYSKSGLQYEGIDECSDVVLSLINFIDEGKPVILWVDCYYQPYKLDTYQSIHWAHTVTVIGYDATQKEFLLIDHKHRESLKYEILNVSYEDVNLMYQGFVHGMKKEPMETFMSFNCSRAIIVNENKMEAYITNVRNNKDKLLFGLEQLDKFREFYGQAIREPDHLDVYITEMLSHLNSVINAKKAERYTMTLIGGAVSYLDKMIDYWINFRSILIKGNLTKIYKEESLAKTWEMINAICALEKKRYNSLLSESDDCKKSNHNMIDHFLDSEGRIKFWPQKKKKILTVLSYISNKFEYDVIYTENEVNQILLEWVSVIDPLSARRALVDHTFLARHSNGMAYWKVRSNDAMELEQ